MMILRSADPSPFVRKVRLAAAILGLEDQITSQPSDTNDATDRLRSENPLGKIPTLVLADGMTLFDSRVILEYLDHLAGGGRILPQAAPARFAALRMQALCDGLMDACILIMYENRWRPAERHEPKWLAHQADKVARGLTAIAAEPPALTATPDVGAIALACLLGYRDLRFGGTWRDEHPSLVAWLDQFAAAVPAFDATRVKP